MPHTSRAGLHHSSEEWMTLKDASAYTQFTDRSLRRFIAEGRLPAYRAGTKHIRIRRSDIDALMRPIPTTTDVVA